MLLPSQVLTSHIDISTRNLRTIKIIPVIFYLRCCRCHVHYYTSFYIFVVVAVYCVLCSVHLSILSLTVHDILLRHVSCTLYDKYNMICVYLHYKTWCSCWNRIKARICGQIHSMEKMENGLGQPNGSAKHWKLTFSYIESSEYLLRISKKCMQAQNNWRKWCGVVGCYELHSAWFFSKNRLRQITFITKS